MGSEEDKLGDSDTPGVPDTTSDVAVARVAGKGPDTRQVWLPSLSVPTTLDSLAPDLRIPSVFGLYSPK